jgi:hypothetical protein
MTAKFRVVEAAAENPAWEQPLIPEGIYNAVFVRSTTSSLRMFGGAPKVFLDFRVVDPGEAFGLIVTRYYRVRVLTAKPGRNGSFRLGKRSELFLMLSRLTVAKLRPDRISPKEFLRGRVLLLRVRTVKTDYRGRPLPATQHYSVVDDVIGTETEKPIETYALCSVQCPA